MQAGPEGQLLVQPQRPDAKAIFFQVWHECWRNVIFFGVLVPVILALGSWARWLGLLGFGIFAVITVLDIARLLIAVGAGMMTLPLALILAVRTRGPLRDEAWLWGATLVQVVELAIFAAYNIYLYRHFWP